MAKHNWSLDYLNLMNQLVAFEIFFDFEIIDILILNLVVPQTIKFQLEWFCNFWIYMKAKMEYSISWDKFVRLDEKIYESDNE